MKKEDISGVIVYILILAIAVVFGITVLRTHAGNTDMTTVIYILYIFGAILVGVLFNAVMFEVAHILGAKAGRYNILSVNILGLLWYREDNKTHFKLSGYDGLTGETKIYPKEDAKKEPNPSAYLLFGTLFYLVEVIAIVITFIALTNKQSKGVLADIAYFILVIAVIGGMILIYNILPFKLDSMTDGYRMRMTTNAANRKAFNELLRVEYAISQGRDDVEIATFEDITNYTADLNLNKVYLLLDKREFEKAEELIDIILKGKDSISQKVYVRARAQKIYINILAKDEASAREFYEKEVPMEERRVLSNDISMVSIRAYLLMSGVMDGSKSECLIAINNVRKCFNNTPKQRRKTEADLFNEALVKVDQVHPTWNLSQYKITIEEKPSKKEEKK